jgi:excisionase family DNA binding protein
MEAKLLTADDTASVLNISPRTLWTLTKERAIPVIQIGRRVLYAMTDIERFIDSQRVGGNLQATAVGAAQ